MTPLQQAINLAYQNPNQQEFINKAYVVFLRTLLFMPVTLRDDSEEPFSPYAIVAQGYHFIPVFDSHENFMIWAGEAADKIEQVTILGCDVIRGISTKNVVLALNPGTDHYKEFMPDELAHLKMMLAKIENLTKSCN